MNDQDTPQRQPTAREAVDIADFANMVHAEIGVAEALDICVRENLIAKAVEVILELLKPTRLTKRGAKRSPVERYRMDVTHFMRADTVRHMRESQAEMAETAAHYRKIRKRRKRHRLTPKEQFHEESHAWFGTTWLRAYECASMELRGTRAAGSPHSMKASYAQVQRWYRTPSATSFCVVSPHIRKRLGIESGQGLIPYDPKALPYYKQTL